MVKDYGKVGVFSLTTTGLIPPPAWISSDKEKSVRVMFAILCAESVLKYFENKYPKDNRPRRAIEAAKGYLKHPTARAARAAADAAYAARAAYMAYAADNAADAAARAAYTAYAEIDFALLVDMAVELIMNPKKKPKKLVKAKK